MFSKDLDALAICNVLKDIVVQVSDSELEQLGLSKGIMHLVDESQQQDILNHFEKRDKSIEMGGSGPNMIRTLALLGQKVSQAGMIGSDKYGDLYLNRVKELGIVSNIKQSDVGSTGTSLILVTPDGERTMNTCLGMSRNYTTKDIPEADIQRAKYLVVTGYQWDTDNQIEAINHAIRIAKENQTQIVFDLADPFCVERHKETFLNILDEYVDIVFSNRKEAEMLTGEKDEAALERLAKHVKMVVLKVGSKGSWVKTPEEKVFCPCTKVNVIDTTAAGDMYAGGFIYGLLNNLSLYDCAKAATFCAETVIQNIGAKVPEDLLERLQHYMQSEKSPELVSSRI